MDFSLTDEEMRALQRKARDFGFWGLGTPSAFGGADLPALTQSLVWTEVGRTFVPFAFGGETDVILYKANDAQREEYLLPAIEGTRASCFAVTEPDAGSDLTAIRMRRLGPQRPGGGRGGLRARDGVDRPRPLHHPVRSDRSRGALAGDGR
jgi:alkylation response protein AidB-like acyl-CoA dehydrogenase